MVRLITVTVPHDKAATIRKILHQQQIVHHLQVYQGDTACMIVCKVVNKKTDEILQLLARYSVGIRYGHIDVVALTSTKPRIATFRGAKPKSHRFMVTDRMSYDEMVDFIDSSIHLTFDYLALIAVGAMICAGGLLTNSAVNVVASMLVSPLMGPIVGMTFGTIVRDKRMFMTSLRNECLGLGVCWLCGVLIGFLVGTFFDSESIDGPMGHNTEMSSRGSFNGLAWGAAIAIPSGLGVALGVSSYTISALIGVAISAALLPPIVNSGVCLGASFIMVFIPSQPDHVVVNHWVKTGAISLGLFAANWIILYLSALVMFRIKRLHYHANADEKGKKLSKFSEMVDDPNDHATTGGGNTFGNNSPHQVSSASIFRGDVSQSGFSASNVTNLHSEASVYHDTESTTKGDLDYPLLQDVEYADTPKKNPIRTLKGRGKSEKQELRTGSTRGTKQYTFPVGSYDENNKKKMMKKKSMSSTNVLAINGGLTQSDGLNAMPLITSNSSTMDALTLKSGTAD